MKQNEPLLDWRKISNGTLTVWLSETIVSKGKKSRTVNKGPIMNYVLASSIPCTAGFRIAKALVGDLARHVRNKYTIE